MTIEKIGRRWYIRGNTYAVKDALKAAGCKWDPDERAWWTGNEDTAKKFDGKEPEAPKAKSPSEIQVVGKARYKGRSYYVRWIGECKNGDYKAHLTTLDAKIDFWAKAARPHELAGVSGDGDVARTEKMYCEPKTLGSIKRFLDEIKQDDEDKKNGNAEMKRCWECGCSFTYLDAKRNGGDWADSYCGC